MNFVPQELINQLKDNKDNLLKINEMNISKINNLLIFFEKVSQIYSSFENINHNFSEDSYGNIQFSLNIQGFYTSHNEFFNSMINIGKKIKNDILNPLENYIKQLNDEYFNKINSIDKIILSLQNQNNRIENLKKLYYNEYEIVEKMEKESIKTANKNVSSKEINDLHNKLLKQRGIMENKSLLYRKEINIANQLYSDYENNYKNILNELGKIEEKKRNFIRNIIKKYLDSFLNSIKYFNSMLNIFEKNINQYDILKDITEFKKNSTKNYPILNNKWNNFIFQSYDKYKSEQNNIININDINDINDINGNDYYEEDEALKSLILGIESGQLMKVGNIEKISSETQEFDFFKDNDYFKNDYILPSDYEETSVKNFCYSILGPNNILDDLLNKILVIINKSDEMFYIKFFKIFLNQPKSSIFYSFSNFLNLAHFNNIIINILANLNFDDIKSISFELLHTIILISEQTYCENTYLCALLCKNKVFLDKNIWIKLIESRIVKKINQKLKKLVDKNKNIFFKKSLAIGNIITNIFQLNKNYIIESTDLFNYVDDYDKIPLDEKKELNEIDTPKYIHSIIKDFINHMCNFNYGLENSSDLVMEICNKYKVKMENINFYVLYLNTSFYTVRTQFQNKQSNDKKMGKIKELYSLSPYTLQLKYPCSLITDKEKIIVLKNVSKYFEDKDLINIFYLNKNTSKALIKKVYLQRLSNDKITLKKRIRIWKAFLKYNNLKKIYIYENIKKDIQNKKIKTKYDQLIELDTRRTNFKRNVNESRKKIEYILKACAYTANNIGYCQGMNFILSFLYEINQNEEDCFYIMLGLLTITDFMEIFVGDLNKLKIFFYILEKLIYLKLPEIYECLKIYNVSMNYFSSPYFITLFTNVYPSFSEIENKVLIKTWDFFIIQGWKSFFSSLLAILEYNKEGILKCKGDELMTYLITKMAKSDIFKSENVEKFCKLRKKFKITFNIIKNLEEEIGIESTIKDVNLNTFISKESTDDNKLE